MKTEEILLQNRNQKQLSLDEFQSKQILARYGVPVVSEAVAVDADQAAAIAEDLGFPVVVKGLGSQLTHKTELGIVRVNIRTPEMVRTVFSEIRQACGDTLEGCLIQPMIKGQREFTAGLIRDPQFGPVVMFGLGGIYAEALKDVVFRVAPITESQAMEMVDELKTKSLLGNFRGQAPAEMEPIAKTLAGLSMLGTEHPDIKEVDINPLIIGEDGQVTAVDGLVVLTETPAEKIESDSVAEQKKAEQLFTDLDTMLHPESIAVIGVPRTIIGPFPGIFRCMKNFGYAGRLYPIHPNADEIEGIKAYPSLKALPEAADLVILSIGAERVPDALRECIETGCRNVHIFASGFAESGEPEGIRLQEEIRKIALDGGLNIIGPNCMGIHVPSERVLTWKSASPESGPIGMISQSGGNAQDFAHLANRMQLYFSKVISYGNAVTMDSTDFLDYFGQDEETDVITMYLEGVKNGQKLLEQVSRISREKPIVIYKGGLTESGARTVASHTGSLAGGEKVWKGFFRQSGAVPVNSLEEMAQTTLALRHLPEIKGRGVTILGTGGGIGVAAADICSRTGLEMPPLSDAVMKKLREYIPPAGNMIKNPIDAHIVMMKLELMTPTLKLLAEESSLNMFILSLHMDWMYGINEGERIMEVAEYLATQARDHLNGKPLVVVWRQYQPNQGIMDVRKQMEKILLDAGIPVYEGLENALTALSKAADYHEFQTKNRNGRP